MLRVARRFRVPRSALRTLGIQVQRQVGEMAAVAAGADFVEHHPQRVDVRRRRARSLRRQISFRADDGTRVARVGHQPDVRQLGSALHEDDVRRFDVAVNETVLVQMRQRGGEGEADVEALREREAGGGSR